jgi:hypothetical protein
MMKRYFWLLLVNLLILSGCATFIPQVIEYPGYVDSKSRFEKKLYRKIQIYLHKLKSSPAPIISPWTNLDSIAVNKQEREIEIFLNRDFAYTPWRPGSIQRFETGWKSFAGNPYKGYEVKFYVHDLPIADMIPNLYQTKQAQDKKRMPIHTLTEQPLITPLDRPYMITHGLQNRHIALWQSHGWYYEQKLRRWEWQRARVFEIVEDLYPMAYILDFLAPMLENAGANVFMPRERDTQLHEIIIDNDSSSAGALYSEISGNWRSDSGAFAIGNPPYTHENPFKLGTGRFALLAENSAPQIDYIPDIPETGWYRVTVSYPDSTANTDEAIYTIYHSGGSSRFKIDQTKGAGMWIDLGAFHFPKGVNPDQAKVTLSCNENKGLLAADAVRFGGGMGNISRDGITSGYPRFAEAARYYLQYAGFPDTLVWDLNKGIKDYNDDYQSRGEWVNYLKGAPFGPNRDRESKGKNIPIELSLGFHTDAGFTRNDTVVGTLMIYSLPDAKDTLVFPDGMHRLANRDLADITQTQITEDLRAKWDPAWNRRPLWNRGYSEAFRPNVPAMLLELLSHHNFLDMKFGNDPRFRFDASRAIYKGMLKFLAAQYGFEPVVQPLAPDHFALENLGGNRLKLSWEPTLDSLEASAVADAYILYTAKEDGGFDNGRFVEENVIILENLEKDILYRFKVCAVNTGGKSFPTEELAWCNLSESKGTVLIVNGFDRLAPPATIETDDVLTFTAEWDAGVPYHRDFSRVGKQYDWNARSPWLDDDAPGHGSSYASIETKGLLGNTFDYSARHGQSIRSAGYSFVSMSDEAFATTEISPEKFAMLDLILGEEKTTRAHRDSYPVMYTAFFPELQEKITQWKQASGAIFISGAYIGSDLLRPGTTKTDTLFANETLRLKPRTNWASLGEKVYTTHHTDFPWNGSLSYNAGQNDDIYTVEAPDAIEPIDTTMHTFLRYADNNLSAGIAGLQPAPMILLGFPFESIPDAQERDTLMEAILKYTKITSQRNFPR